VGQIDEIKIKSSEYLMETAHSFRVYLKTHLQGVKSKANPNPAPVPKPDVLNIWVAKTFPAWQSCILTALKTHHEKCGTLPDNKVLATEFGSKPELKKYAKRVMPFVQATREKVNQLGPKALALTLEFDEAQVLKDNSVYLANTLNVDEVVVRYTDDEAAEEKMKECCPGAPFVQFATKPGVKVEFLNPVPNSGLFSQTVVVNDGDTYERVVQKLTKDVKIKSVQSVQLWRFEDPVLGDRKIPIFQEPTKGKVLVEPGSRFKVDVAGKKVSVVTGSKVLELGSSVIYLVD
jgi:leucyl-tRNA synthetase